MATTTIENIQSTATSLNGAEYFMISQGGLTKKVLFSTLNISSDNPKFQGPATPSTNPGTPSGGVFYSATEPGTYTNFKDTGGAPIVVGNNEIATLKYNGSSWEKISQTVDSASYVHIKFSDDGGQTFTGNDGDDTGKYLGVYTDFNKEASTDVTDYKWVKIEPEKPKDGEDGRTTFLHMKFSDDGGQTFTGNDGDDTGKYLGVYTDFSEESSNYVADYKWVKIKGDDGTGTTYRGVDENDLP